MFKNIQIEYCLPRLGELSAKGHRNLSGVRGKFFILIWLMIPWDYSFINIHWAAYFRFVYFAVCKKPVFSMYGPTQYSLTLSSRAYLLIIIHSLCDTHVYITLLLNDQACSGLGANLITLTSTFFFLRYLLIMLLCFLQVFSCHLLNEYSHDDII